MKKLLKRLTVSLAALTLTVGSTCTAFLSVNAANNEVQPRAWYVYGDVNNDGSVDIADAAAIIQFIGSFKSEHGNNPISVEKALKYDCKYSLDVPQAADIDGDGFITEADHICIQYYEAGVYDKIGRCGQPFYIS